MARIKLVMPQQQIASINIPIRITDINYGNHVGNDAFAAILHEARMAWLHRFGYTELTIEGCGLIMTGLSIEFKAEGFYGDIAEVVLACSEISRNGFELYYQVSTTRHGEQKVLAIAQTCMLCFDYEARKVVSIPAGLLKLLKP